MQKEEVSFELNRKFILQFINLKPDFGFNGVGEFSYLRSYSRVKENGKKEKWYETLKRVVEGTYKIQKQHILQNGLFWNEKKAQRSAQQMYRYMFDMKFLPPGRGLWAMGTPIIEEKGLFEALNNCAFVSTKDIQYDFVRPFAFMMDASMLGIGVGFDVKGAGKRGIVSPQYQENTEIRTFIVPDSREGWVEAVSKLLKSYVDFSKIIWKFDYSKIRPKGTPLKTFGGYSSGYKPLEECIEGIRMILDNHHHKSITETGIADIMNIIGDCVVAGGIRRTAQIAFGESEEFINLKNYNINPQRAKWMHRSNNSKIVKPGSTDYKDLIPLISKNGEPGIFWLDNARDFGRMGVFRNEKMFVDRRAEGGNPCLEQTLEHMEMCCLVETFPNRCKNLNEFKDVLKYAYLYAKTVTLGRTHWEETNRVMLRNRRIGTSVSGIAQFIEKHGISELRTWLQVGYDAIMNYDETYSEWFAIPISNKVTSVKPSGTISLLAGATPGIHYPVSRYYIRHIRVNSADPIVEYAKKSGLEVVPELKRNERGEWVENPYTMVVKFYVDTGIETREQTLWEQLELTAFMQEYWSDNQVSVSVYFNPEKESQDLARALEFYQYRLKGISIFPRVPLEGEYKMLPYEKISEVEYERCRKEQLPVDMNSIEWRQPEADKWCTTDKCEVSYD